MKKDIPVTPDELALRQKAEKMLGNIKQHSEQNLSEADNKRLLHELQVHQIELEMMNEELKASRDFAEINASKYEELYNFAPFGYLSLLPDGKITELNFSSANILGSDRSLIINRNFESFLSNDSKECFLTFLKKVFKFSEKASCELLLNKNKKDTTYVYLEGRNTANSDICSISMIDITVRKQALAQVQKNAEELKVLNDSKIKLFSIISHDLRGPFHSILNISDIITTESASLTQKEIDELNIALNSSLKKINNMINELLNWAMAQLKGSVPEKDIFSIYAKTNQVIESFRANALEKNIEIFNLIPEEIILDADPNMLGLVMRNLLSNAIKFTNTGGKIEISGSKKNDIIEISVCDNGIGIPEKILDNFSMNDVFKSTHGTKDESGYGLGLNLCKEIINKHGGKLNIRNNNSSGCTVSFTLPLV